MQLNRNQNSCFSCSHKFTREPKGYMCRNDKNKAAVAGYNCLAFYLYIHGLFMNLCHFHTIFYDTLRHSRMELMLLHATFSRLSCYSMPFYQCSITITFALVKDVFHFKRTHLFGRGGPRMMHAKKGIIDQWRISNHLNFSLSRFGKG